MICDDMIHGVWLHTIYPGRLLLKGLRIRCLVKRAADVARRGGKEYCDGAKRAVLIEFLDALRRLSRSYVWT